MPSIIREKDGATFITPDYRELTSAKKASLLKREILMLSTQHGDFSHIRKKNKSQYEIAFSHETGFLLGESIWQHFNKPYNMVYCEPLPDTAEAILVVVTSGSIFIDTKIPVLSIPEELAVFISQEHEFDIYIYGDVPISAEKEEGKFSFSKEATKKFTVLEESLFENLKQNHELELLPTTQALKKQRIGTLPVKNIVIISVIAVIAWLGWSKLTVSTKNVLPKIIISVVDPYTLFLNTLSTPAPDASIRQLVNYIERVSEAPGWEMTSISFTKKGGFQSYLLSSGNNISNLKRWAYLQHISIDIDNKGISANIPNTVNNRAKPNKIFKLQNVLGNIVDRINNILPGNAITLHPIVSYSQYKEISFSITIEDVTPTLLSLLAEQFTQMPVAFDGAELTVSNNGFISGTLTLTALGN